MKILLAILILAGAASAQMPYEKVAIVQETSRPLLFGYATGSGHGNVIDASGIYGFDFTYQKCKAFGVSNGPTDLYKAHSDGVHDLTLLSTTVGTETVNECHMKITVRNFRYGIERGQLVTLPFIVSDSFRGRVYADNH